MPPESLRALLGSLDGLEDEDRWTTICFVAGTGVELDPDERHATLRRAELLLAAGGDPRRDPEFDGRAVGAVAADLDSPAARAQLHARLVALEAEARGVPAAREALARLTADDELAWRCFARALLSASLADDEELA